MKKKSITTKRNVTNHPSGTNILKIKSIRVPKFMQKRMKYSNCLSGLIQTSHPYLYYISENSKVKR